MVSFSDAILIGLDRVSKTDYVKEIAKIPHGKYGYGIINSIDTAEARCVILGTGASVMVHLFHAIPHEIEHERGIIIVAAGSDNKKDPFNFVGNHIHHLHTNRISDLADEVMDMAELINYEDYLDEIEIDQFYVTQKDMLPPFFATENWWCGIYLSGVPP